MDYTDRLDEMEEMERLDSLDIPMSPKKRQRTTFSDEIVDEFEKLFQGGEKNPNKEVRLQLSLKYGLDVKRIQIWFQNRRAKEAREARLEPERKKLKVVDDDDFGTVPLPLSLFETPTSSPLVQEQIITVEDEAICPTNLTYAERFRAYNDDILVNTRPCEVETIFSVRLERLKWGFKAKWKLEKGGERLVKVEGMVLGERSGRSRFMVRVSSLTGDFTGCLRAPLSDVYPTKSHPDEALLFEHTRFFYRNLWRDADAFSDVHWAGQFLEARLRYCYDSKEGILSAPVILLQEEQEVRLVEIKKLQGEIKQLEGQNADAVDLKMKLQRLVELYNVNKHAMSLLDERYGRHAK